MLPEGMDGARLVGRVWRPGLGAPSVVILRGETVIDVTGSLVSVSDFLEDENPAARFDALQGEEIGSVHDLVLDPERMGYDTDRPCLLAPIDFQAVKACGVTFARSMVERVIDERTAGDPERADAIRTRIGDLIGGSLANIEAGSARAAEVKAAL